MCTEKTGRGAHHTCIVAVLVVGLKPGCIVGLPNQRIEERIPTYQTHSLPS